jgi:hypothetical protein
MSVLLSTVLNLAFALSVLGFLIMHMSLVAGNTTTIEVPFFIVYLSSFIFSSFPGSTEEREVIQRNT